MAEKEESICGEVIDINYDKEIKQLNLELIKDENGTPIIKFQDWTGDGKDLFSVHIKEAIRLKSVIDSLVVEYLENMKE
jgi:hypothetical protein